MTELDFSSDGRLVTVSGNNVTIKELHSGLSFYSYLRYDSMIRLAMCLREEIAVTDYPSWSLRVGSSDMMLILKTLDGGFTDVIIPKSRSTEVARAIHDEVTSYANV